MLRGVYTSATGMEAEKLKHEVLADNLANVNTSGYKSYKNVYKAYAQSDIYNLQEENPVGNMSFGTEAYDTATNHEQGAFKTTGNPLDIALSGKGFFPIQTADGGLAYTRNGHFNISRDGFLVTQAGDYLLDTGLSPVFVGNENVSTVTVQRNGALLVNGEFSARIQAYDFPAGAHVKREAYDKFTSTGVNTAMQLMESTTLLQGSLEMSNVSAVKGAAEMVQVMRNYEANQKAMTAQFETLGYLMQVADSI